MAIASVSWQQTGGFLVSWPTQSGIVYRVQWKNALSDSSWQSITTPDVTGTGAPMNWLDDGSQTGGLSLPRFYRVTVP